MKKIILLLVVFFASFTFPQNTEGNDYKITDATISSGQSALSSGIGGSFTVQNTDMRLIFEVSSNYVQFMYGWYDEQWFVSGSGGYFNNTPWIGPMISYSPIGWFSLCTWEGVCGGTDGKPNTKEINFYFAYNNAKVSYSILFIQYSVIHFQNDVPNNLPGVGLKFPLDGFRLSLSCDYSLRDDKPLFGGSLFVPIN